MVLLSLAWNTMFWMAFTFVGEPDRPHWGEVAVNVGYAPFGQVEVIALVIQIGIVEVTLLFFRNGFGVFVLLYQLGVTRTAGSSRAVDCDNDGSADLLPFQRHRRC